MNSRRLLNPKNNSKFKHFSATLKHHIVWSVQLSLARLTEGSSTSTSSCQIYSRAIFTSWNQPIICCISEQSGVKKEIRLSRVIPSPSTSGWFGLLATSSDTSHNSPRICRLKTSSKGTRIVRMQSISNSVVLLNLISPVLNTCLNSLSDPISQQSSKSYHILDMLIQLKHSLITSFSYLVSSDTFYQKLFSILLNQFIISSMLKGCSNQMFMITFKWKFHRRIYR